LRAYRLEADEPVHLPSLAVMKRILIMLGVAAALAAAWPSHAQQGPPPGRRTMDRQQPMQPMRPQRELPARPADYRERDEPRRHSMTPDERRQLRRDITDHGREVYRDRRPPQ
jgi:hypothetical protein